MMMAIFAQLPDPQSAQAIGFIALAIFCLVGGINQILKLTDRFKENPPSHVQYATKAEASDLRTALLTRATKAEHDELHDVLQGHIKTTEEAFREAARLSSASREKIYIQMREQGVQIAKIGVETTSQTKQIEHLGNRMSEVNGRIDELPQRTIALLKSTKELHG